MNPFIYTRPNLGSLSARQFDTRLREHQLADSNLDKRKSALADQVCQTKHSFAWGEWRYTIPLAFVVVRDVAWNASRTHFSLGAFLLQTHTWELNCPL